MVPTESSNLMATEAFAIIAMFSGIAALTVAILFVALPNLGKTPSAKLPLISMALNFFTCKFEIFFYKCLEKKCGIMITSNYCFLHN